jgi:hypothetical protein
MNDCKGRCYKCNEICKKCKDPIELLLPPNKDLPFFAYGLFKNGELGFHQIRDFVERINYCEIEGELYEKDGIPLYDYGNHKIKGQLIYFKSGESTKAYNRIAEMEPNKIYEWVEIPVNGEYANILHGIKIDKESHIDNKKEWGGKNDPFFSKTVFGVIKSIQDECGSEPPGFHDFDFEPQLRLQMAYLLLWSAIERYVTLKYCFAGKSINAKLRMAAQESAFKDGLKTYVKKNRTVLRSDSNQKVTLNPSKVNSSMDYYYAVRSNSTHRGKAIAKDFYILKESLEELLNIFKLMLDRSFEIDESFFVENT